MVTLTSRGPSYFLHKTLRRALSPWPTWKRRLVYSNPKQYWLHRGGEEYFLEQEGQADRTRRSLWLAERIARYQPTSTSAKASSIWGTPICKDLRISN